MSRITRHALEKLEQKKAEANYYWDTALFELRQATTMNTFGTYVEYRGEDRECLMSVCGSDRDGYKRNFMDKAAYYAKQALTSEVM